MRKRSKALSGLILSGSGSVVNGMLTISSSGIPRFIECKFDNRKDADECAAGGEAMDEVTQLSWR
jgi:hypothetical protein